MNRKAFLKNTGLGLLGATLATGCMNESASSDNDTISKPNKKYKWKMVTTWPPSFPILGEACNLMAEKVRIMSDGRLDIHVYGGGELVPPLETFDAVQSGSVQIGSSSAYYWAGKMPAAQIFGSIPFGFNAQMMNTWLTAGNGMKLWRDLYAKHGLIPFNGGNTGAQMGGWFNKKIESIDDFVGLKMRIPGLGGKVLKKAGGTPVLSPASEIYTNLERGVIDATEWVGPYHDYFMGFHEIAKYYYYPGWHETGTVSEYIVNKKAYESLPQDLQEILGVAANEIGLWVLSSFEYKNAEYLEKIKSDAKIEILPFPIEVLDKLREYSTQTMKEISDSDEDFNLIYQDIVSFTSTMKPYINLAHKSYYTDINR